METQNSAMPIAAVFVLLLFRFSSAQLSSSDVLTLIKARTLLEYPPVLNGWNRYTSFCSLPPSSSLTVVCTQNRVTELSIVGNKGSPTVKNSAQKFLVSPQTLSSGFSIDSLFTTLSRLSNLEVLSLVSLGMWGPFPAKINRFESLRVLNVSSNFINGQIPQEISSLVNLQSLGLGNNLLNGAVPDLSGLTALQELDLGNNLLGPGFPSLGDKLVSIILKNNSFHSSIPPQIKNFNNLQRLDASFNKLLGPIPSSLFSLPAIQYLNLAGNSLSGALGGNTTCSNDLRFVDLSHNLLIGQLPLCVRANSSKREVHYSWNCLSSVDSVYQHTSSFCHQEPVAAVTPSLKKHTSKSKLGLLLGICGASIVFLAVLGILVWVFYGKKAAHGAEKGLFNKSAKDKVAHQASPRVVADARHMSQGVRMGAMNLPAYKVLTLEELEEATNYFDLSNLLEEGTHVKIYKGWLREGSAVVVRCLKLNQKCSPQTLTQYVEVISKLRHRHVVSILGHHVDSDNIYLVFEHVSSGTLRSHLTEKKPEMLKWPQRVAAAIGVARGIQFLHTGLVPSVVGNDLKIDNILLDEHLIVKISGYNLPLPSKDKSSKGGSESPFGVGSDDIASKQGEKDDIYQLGVILLQLVTGNFISSRKEADALMLKLEKCLVDEPKKLQGTIDSSMRGTYAYESVRTAVEIAINCLSTDLSKRPTVEDVLWNLQYSVQVQDAWTSSENLSTPSQRFM